MNPCCKEDIFAYNSSGASDADGAVDQGQQNPNCPDGYVWGGMSCVREAGESEVQLCSTGYIWDGTRCVQATADSLVCAKGWFKSGSSCVQCAIQGPPTLVPSPGQIEIDFTVAASLPFVIYRKLGTEGEFTRISPTLAIGSGAPSSFVDNTTVAGVVHYYKLSVYQSTECGYTDGEVASALAV